MNVPSNLGDFIRRTDEPSRPLIIGVGPGQVEHVMTRAALDEMADAFARGLLKRGIKRGERIAILAANRPDFVALLLGAMRAGVVPVPVNFKFPAATIANVIADCGARLVVHDDERRAAVEPENFRALPSSHSTGQARAPYRRGSIRARSCRSRRDRTSLHSVFTRPARPVAQKACCCRMPRICGWRRCAGAKPICMTTAC